jgi:hypothetical protein
MRFQNTERNYYTQEKVRKMREARKTLTPAKTGVPATHYQAKLGELKGAGHMKFAGPSKVTIEALTSTTLQSPVSASALNINPTFQKNYTVQFSVNVEQGDKPHLTGYLQSAADVDRQQYRVKGWINEDGTLRLEIVK